MPSVADIISRIDTKIYDLINDAGDITSYRIGDKRVDKTQMLAEMRKLREHYAKKLEEVPYEDIRHIALDFDEIGQEEIEQIGDAI